MNAPLFLRPVRALAPMEGLTDPPMRKILTRLAKNLGAPYDWAVSEFVRVTHYPLPAHVFYKYLPELRQGGRTESGTPVHAQLLGSNPETVAQSAATVASLGAHAVDLNFGCPAKTVNNHKGGAALLEDPQSVYRVCHAVRQAVDKGTPVSAKIRLGYRDDGRLPEIGFALKEAGVDWITVHARTKTDGYKPPAYWEKIAPLTLLGMPVIANGEIWSAFDAARCAKLAHTPHLMLGRGAVRRPDLVASIANGAALDWRSLCAYQLLFLAEKTDNPKGLIGRYKQWLGMLSQGYDEAAVLWQSVKKQNDANAIVALVQKSQSGAL